MSKFTVTRRPLGRTHCRGRGLHSSRRRESRSGGHPDLRQVRWAGAPQEADLPWWYGWGLGGSATLTKRKA